MNISTEERAIRQRAYDDGYEDGRLDVNVEYEREIKRLKSIIEEMTFQADEIRDEAYAQGRADGRLWASGHGE